MSFILTDQPAEHVTRITLNRPERMNAMAFDVMVPLREALEEVGHDNDTRVIVLTGAGRGFCSGADQEDSGVVPHVKGLRSVPMFATRANQALEDVVSTLRHVPQPIIAAINGPTIGGGLALSLWADIRVAATSAYFRAAGINNGLNAAEYGLSFLLPRAIGSSRSMEMMLTGRDVDAEEAARIGLVSQVVADEDLMPTVLDMAQRIIGWSQLGIEVTKKVAWAGLEATSVLAHMDHENRSQLFVRLTTENFQEAIVARKEKRPPVFND